MNGNSRGLTVLELLIFLVVLVVVVWVAVKLVPGHSEKDRLARQREELRKAVVTAGSPLVDDPQMQATDYSAAAMKLAALYGNRKLEFDDPELSKTWAQIETQADEGLMMLQRIARVDNETPSGYEVVARVLEDDNSNNQDDSPLAREGAAWIAMKLDESQMEGKFRAAEEKLDTSLGGLQTIADGLSRNELQSAIAVDYLPSWEGTFWGDEVEVQNTSGTTLENAAVFVTVHQNEGGSKTHLHYVKQWPNGAKLRALYAYSATDYEDAQAVANPDSVDVAVYVPAGTARAKYVLTPEEWDKRVEAYCSGLTFTGNYLAPYAEDISNQQYHAEYQFSFQGIKTLPVKSVELRFTSSSGAVQSAVWTPNQMQRLTAGQPFPIRSELLDGDAPAHIEYIVSFPDSGYQKEIQAY